MLPLQFLNVKSILQKFREYCYGRGWKIGEEGNWFKINNEYHMLVWAKSISDSTFKTIAYKRMLSIIECDRWTVRYADYIAFISMTELSDDLLQYIHENSELLSTIVFYDLSNLERLGKPVSPVFADFEAFLKLEYRLRFDDRKYINKDLSLSSTVPN